MIDDQMGPRQQSRPFTLGGPQMKSNLSQAERVFRILIGSSMVTTSITGILGAWSFYFGVALLLSATVSYCLFYAILGINGCESKDVTESAHSNASTSI